MAPTLSKLKQYQSSLICLSGLSAAAWIIIYGKSSNKKPCVSLNLQKKFIIIIERPVKHIYLFDIHCFQTIMTTEP